MDDLHLLPYGRQSIDEEDVEAVVEVLRSDWLTTGPKVEEFEAALADAAEVTHAVVVNSGSAALHVAYFASGIAPGSQVLTSPLTFVSTASCALHLGAQVGFCDVDPDTGNLDPDVLEDRIGDQTRLIVAVDYAGHPADYGRIMAAAGPREIAVVADGAHSLGARRAGKSAASLADATATSFHPVKVITSAEGGGMLTNRQSWAERAALFRNHGIERRTGHVAANAEPWYYEVQALGLNYRLPDVLCALGLSQLAKLERFVQRRRSIAERYSQALADVPGLELPKVESDVEPSWHLYVIRTREADRREALFRALRSRGLGVQLHYYPVHLHPLFARMGYRKGSCPVAEDFAARAISLPLFPAMTEQEIARVIEAVAECAKATL